MDLGRHCGGAPASVVASGGACRVAAVQLPTTAAQKDMRSLKVFAPELAAPETTKRGDDGKARSLHQKSSRYDCAGAVAQSRPEVADESCRPDARHARNGRDFWCTDVGPRGRIRCEFIRMSMSDKPPRYLPQVGSAALARRLRALLDSEAPASCPVYAGLQGPGVFSSRHAEATHLLAQGLVDHAAETLPHFNTTPPPISRILTAASWGRVDAMGSQMERFPDDLASRLWWQVAEQVDNSGEMTVAERRCASDVMLRLGYVRKAAELLGMVDAQPATFVFSPDYALEELQVFRRTRHETRDLEELALAAAQDPRLCADIRMRMATFVVVKNGQRGADTSDLHQSAGLAHAAMDSLDCPPFARSLAQQTVYRAVAFVPFVARDASGTWAMLDEALSCQLAASPSNDAETLAWRDHAFPLFQTIARTHLLLGEAEEASKATERLVELSPNDQRTWDIRGQALLASDRLEQALVTYDRMRQLGGLPVARAAFYMAWIHQRLGDLKEAVDLYRLSLRIDPTVPAVDEAINRLQLAGKAAS